MSHMPQLTLSTCASTAQRKVHMEIEHLDAELKAHEHKSQTRFEQLQHEIKQLTPNSAKEHQMSEGTHIRNIVEPSPMGGMLPFLGGGGIGGAGAGGLAGVAGGVLGGLLTRGGLFGGEGRGFGGEGVVTPSQLTSALAGVTDTQMNTAVLQTLGDIKASVPLAEGQTQLAIAGSQSDLTNLINAANVANLQGQFAINKNVSDTTAQIIATEVATQVAVSNAAAGINLGIANLATAGLQNTFSLSQAISADGDKTRAILIAQNDAMLNRQLAVAEAALLEQRAVTRGRETEINITNTNTAIAAQSQSQQMQQAQLQILAQLNAGFNNLCNDMQAVRQTQSNVVFGNQTGSNQTASAANNKVG